MRRVTIANVNRAAKNPGQTVLRSCAEEIRYAHAYETSGTGHGGRPRVDGDIAAEDDRFRPGGPPSVERTPEAVGLPVVLRQDSTQGLLPIGGEPRVAGRRSAQG